MNRAKYTIDKPKDVCNNAQNCFSFEHNRLLIERLETVNKQLAIKENRLIKENNRMVENLTKIRKDFQRMSDYISELQTTVNVVSTKIKDNSKSLH